jgi:hypothetical protein
MRTGSLSVTILSTEVKAMDKVEAGFFVTAVTSTIVLVTAIAWLAILP